MRVNGARFEHVRGSAGLRLAGPFPRLSSQLGHTSNDIFARCKDTVTVFGVAEQRRIRPLDLNEHGESKRPAAREQVVAVHSSDPEEVLSAGVGFSPDQVQELVIQAESENP